MHRQLDTDSQETTEWVDALESVLAAEGPQRAHYLLEQLVDKARRSGAYLPYSPNTAYLNTIPPHLEERSPGDYELEHRLRSFVRWNAVAMVLRAGKRTWISAATSPASPPPRRCTTWASTISGARPPRTSAATSSTSRGTRPPASTPAPSPKGGSRKISSTTSARRSTARGSRPTRTRGSCRTSGSSRRCRWGSGRSRRSTRRASCTTSTTAGSPTPRSARSGRSWATARWTSPSRWAPSASGHARGSTT